MDTINLRGHHLSSLAKDLRFLKSRGYDWRKPDTANGLTIKRPLWTLLSGEASKVRIVRGIDSVCRKCKGQNSSCFSKGLLEEDDYNLREYGLKPQVGNNTGEYTREEIFELLELYPQVEGFSYPLIKYLEVELPVRNMKP